MAFITVAGEDQIAVKQGASQILDITHFVLANIAGLGAEPVNRIEAMPAAGNIMATLPYTKKGYVNGNQVVYSLVMDSSIGDFDFNWVGLKDADGVLIACTYTPLIQKRKTTGAIPGNNLTRNFLIAFSGILATTAIAVPAETWQIDFNARLWGIDERERLSNYDIYGHEGFFGDGWKAVRDGATTTYNVQPGIGYVGGVRIASAIVQPVTVAGPPKSIWVDASLQGDISDVSAVVDFVIDAVAHADYTDANGFKHYVTKIADIAADGSVTDVRVSADNIVPQAEAEGGIATIIRNWTAQRVAQAISANMSSHGQCRLSVASATSLKLAPYNGKNLIIGGVRRKFATADGVTISNSGLAANTVYYVYATWSGTAIALALSTTGHGTLDSGVEVKSTDANSTLVGMIRTKASAQFVDSYAQRFCLNWFNRELLGANQGFAANRTTASTGLVEISPSERLEFLAWAGETSYVSSPVNISQNSTVAFASSLYIDGTSASNQVITPHASGALCFLCPQWAAMSAVDGYHYASVYGAAAFGATATWSLSSTVLTAIVRG